MAEDLPTKIFNAIKEIQGSNDPEVFVKRLLGDTLNWPIQIDDIEEFDFDELGYDWNSELEEMGLRSDEGIQDLFKIAAFPGWPLGIFVVRFGSNSIFRTGRGMTTPLRKLLRNLVVKRRPTANHQTWPQDRLLFLCHHEHEYFQFAHFTNVNDKNLPKLQTFGWGPDDHIRTLCESNIQHLKYEKGLSPSKVIENINKAFSVKIVTVEFYSEYKSTFADFKAKLLKHAGYDDDDDIHSYVQLVFNRFLFLRFIEKKGWLRFGDDGNYLRNLYNSFVDRGYAFYKDGFLPMALKGLVVPGEQKSDVYGEVELIGGGLFEASKFDSEFSSLPNEMFSPIIGAEGLLYRYNFTVQESTPLDVQVAIDPEMIGTMFEELVTDRDGKGAFYTPRIVVSYMCKEGIKSVLGDKTDVDEEKISQLVDNENTTSITIQEAKQISEALDGIKAIDPACGSGAYLLGLLQEIIKIHENLQTLSPEFERSKYDLKLHIISRSIFGADIDPFATQIAMLRLWLSLAVESEDPVQLPNLDFNIETGDSLLAPNPSQVNWLMPDLYVEADKLAEKKEIYLSTKSNVKRLREEIRSEEAKIRSKIRKNPNQKGIVDFRIHFAGVFSKNGGFDLVLANPPYVRQEEINKSNKKQMLKDYGSGSIKAVTGKSDLYCYFYIRANQLLRSDGVSIFICSNSWMDVGFGIGLQEYLLRNNQIKMILDSGVEKQFLSADINTVITIMKKSTTSNEPVTFRMLNDKFEESIWNSENYSERIIYQTELTSLGEDEGVYVGSKWTNQLKAPELYWDLCKNKNMVKLGDVVDISFGIKTGCNEFFYIDEDDLKKWKIEKEFLVPAIKSPSEFREFQISQENISLKLFLCQSSKTILNNSKALDYIQWGESKGFDRRSSVKSRKNWYNIGDKTAPKFAISTTINRFARIYEINDPIYVSDNFGEIRMKPKFSQYAKELGTIFQSTLFNFMVELGGRNPYGGGAMKIQMYEMNQLKIPNPKLIKKTPRINRELFSNISEELNSSDRAVVDDAVYESIQLTNNERKTIQLYYEQILRNRVVKSNSVSGS